MVKNFCLRSLERDSSNWFSCWRLFRGNKWTYILPEYEEEWASIPEPELRKERNYAGYLVQFKVPGVEQPSFGEIHCFIKAGRVGHAVVNVLSNSNTNVCQGEHSQPKDLVVKEFLSSGVLGYHFFGVKRTRTFKLIRCDQISTKGHLCQVQQWRFL